VRSRKSTGKLFNGMPMDMAEFESGKLQQLSDEMQF